MRVRKLEGGDIRRVISVIGPAIKTLSSNGSIKKMIDSAGDKDSDSRKGDAMELGAELISSLLLENIDPLWDWLADLAGTDTAGLDKMPLDAPIIIIEEVTKDDQFGPFIKRCSDLLTKAL